MIKSFFSTILSFGIFAVFIFHLFGCAGGNLKISINEDKSGKIAIYEKKVKNLPVRRVASSLGYQETQVTALEIIEREARFANIESLLLPGIGFRSIGGFDNNEEHLLIYLDTSIKSPLWSFLSIDPENIQRIQNLSREKDELLRFNTQSESFLFEIVFPYNVKLAKFTSDRDPAYWSIRIENLRKVVVRMPLPSFAPDTFALTEIQIFPK